MRCDTCCYWKPHEHWNVSAGGLRRCDRVLPKHAVENRVPKAMRGGRAGYEGDGDPETAVYVAAVESLFSTARAVVNDECGLYPELLTRADFGCALHEANL